MSDPAPPPPTIYTIGHGNESFDALAERLERHHCRTIVDVRSVPFSKHAPDFVKAELEEITAEAGFGYRWLGDRLGGRPSDPALCTDGKPDPDKIVASPRFESGIAEVLALAEHSTVALLCSELDHRHCHRSTWIADGLERAGHRVLHIDAAGDANAHQPELGW